jgi:hypothetical protein
VIASEEPGPLTWRIRRIEGGRVVSDTGDMPVPAIASLRELGGLILHSPKLLAGLAVLFLALGCIVTGAVVIVLAVV